ncbi:hypothetical protein GH721_03975 [Kriegella sp. EG-1]|nr:hypothetical protein [Flavobacteriaceae bacterium EG-1]
MDTNLTVVNVLIVASVFAPLFILINIGNKNKRKISKQFKSLAHKYMLNITNQEYWGNALIGIDVNKQKLLFLRLENDSFTEYQIDLTKVVVCKINATYKSKKTKQKKENILEKVDLQLYFPGHTSNLISLNFYDHNRLFNENLEVMRAEKWKGLIMKQ